MNKKVLRRIEGRLHYHCCYWLKFKQCLCYFELYNESGDLFFWLLFSRGQSAEDLSDSLLSCLQLWRLHSLLSPAHRPSWCSLMLTITSYKGTKLDVPSLLLFFNNLLFHTLKSRLWWIHFWRLGLISLISSHVSKPSQEMNLSKREINLINQQMLDLF